MDVNALKDASGSELDEMGVAAGLPRVSRATGHGFDETDDSYRRRLHASVAGAAAAGATSQPVAMLEGQDARDAIEAPEESGPVAVLEDGSVVRGNAAAEILALRDALREAGEELESTNAELRQAKDLLARAADRLKEGAATGGNADAATTETPVVGAGDVQQANVGGDGAGAAEGSTLP
jgi:hypothetical protein